MRKAFFPVLMAGTLMLGGCAAYGNDPLAGILGSVLGGGLGGYDQGYGQGYGSNSQFQTAAVNACGQEAAQYGQVRVTDVRQMSRDTLRVDGQVSSNYRQRSWACAFRADGRITDFQMG